MLVVFCDSEESSVLVPVVVQRGVNNSAPISEWGEPSFYFIAMLPSRGTTFFI